MNLDLKKIGDLISLQANGTPAEIAEFLVAANLVEIPLTLTEDEDALADLDVADAVAQ